MIISKIYENLNLLSLLPPLPPTTAFTQSLYVLFKSKFSYVRTEK